MMINYGKLDLTRESLFFLEKFQIILFITNISINNRYSQSTSNILGDHTLLGFLDAKARTSL